MIEEQLGPTTTIQVVRRNQSLSFKQATHIEALLGIVKHAALLPVR